jgi:hypothetical protein
MHGITAYLPASKRRRARMDKHAADQASYRKNLKVKRAPDREDFGRAALACCLGLYARDPSDKRAQQLRNGILTVLTDLGFDPEQTAVRYGRMAERSSDDLKAWHRGRS